MTDATVSCPKCATEVPSGTLLCASCGHTMGGSDTDTPARPARTSATERTLALRANVPVQQPKGKQKQQKPPASPDDEAAERARQEAEAARLEVEKAKKEAERLAAERARAEKAAAKEAARLAAEQAKAAKKSERAARDAAGREAKARDQRSGGDADHTPSDGIAVDEQAAGTAGADTPTRRRASATDRVNALRAPSDGSAPTRPAKLPKPAKPPKAPRATKPADRDEQRRRGGPVGQRRPAGASSSSRLFGAAAVLAIFVIAGAGVAVLRGSDSGADGPSGGFGAEPSDVAMPDLPLQSSRFADLIEGSGEPADVGDTLTVDYVYFRSSTGEQIDSTFQRGEPWTFVLGAGEVIEGLDRGLIGTKAGGRRQLDIVPELAYGDTGIEGVIGAGETLTFVVDVVSIVEGSPPTDPTTTTSTTLPPDPEETALAGLTVEVEQGREVAATLTGTWALQLAVEYVGLEVDGVALDAQTIFTTFQERLADYPVLMLDAAEWELDISTEAPDTLYITVVGLPFNTRTEARAWAENNGIASDAYELIDFPAPAT